MSRTKISEMSIKERSELSGLELVPILSINANGDPEVPANKALRVGSIYTNVCQESTETGNLREYLFGSDYEIFDVIGASSVSPDTTQVTISDPTGAVSIVNFSEINQVVEIQIIDLDLNGSSNVISYEVDGGPAVFINTSDPITLAYPSSLRIECGNNTSITFSVSGSTNTEVCSASESFSIAEFNDFYVDYDSQKPRILPIFTGSYNQDGTVELDESSEDGAIWTMRLNLRKFSKNRQLPLPSSYDYSFNTNFVLCLYGTANLNMAGNIILTTSGATYTVINQSSGEYIAPTTAGPYVATAPASLSINEVTYDGTFLNIKIRCNDNLTYSFSGFNISGHLTWFIDTFSPS